VACHSLCIGCVGKSRYNYNGENPNLMSCCIFVQRLGQTHLMWLSLTIMEAEVSFAYALEAAPLRAARATTWEKNFIINLTCGSGTCKLQSDMKT
jgi:hypothetical protein